MRLRKTLNCTMLSGCSEISNNQFTLKFAFFKDVFEVFTDVRFRRMAYLHKD